MNEVLANINAMCLINALDTIERLYGNADSEIEKRYGTEEDGINIALKYIELAERSNMLCRFCDLPVSTRISQPTEDGHWVPRNFVFREGGSE